MLDHESMAIHLFSTALSRESYTKLLDALLILVNFQVSVTCCQESELISCSRRQRSRHSAHGTCILWGHIRYSRAWESKK